MQLHRITEIQTMRETFMEECHELEDRVAASRAVYELPKLSVIKGLTACGYSELPQDLEIPGATDFDCFVSVADKCRGIFVARERRKAGYTDAEIVQMREQFDRFDRDRSGTIDCSELAKVLEAFGWKPKTRAERDDLLNRLEKARLLAKAAGVQEVTHEGSAEVSFWEFIQLKRMIQRHDDTAHEEHMHKLMKELKFTPQEAGEFREIFRKWLEEGHGDESDEDGSGNGNAGADKNSVPKRVARQQVRSMCGKVGPDRRRALETELNALATDTEGIDFEKFLRLMRWLLDTNFLADALKKAEKS
jgi:Ca2+-binding EF-hand superfamily protein